MSNHTDDQFPFGLDPHRIYNQIELGEKLGLKPSTLEARRSNGNGPPFVKMGRLVRYPGRLVIAWLESRVVRNTQKFGRNGE